MTVIQVERKDSEKTFEVLLNNGRFRGIGDNKFDIIEHVEEVIQKLKKAGVHIKRIVDSEHNEALQNIPAQIF